MIDTTRTWARLAPIPAEAADFTIKAEGNMFTRRFRASFRASPGVIQKWLSNSPGTKDAEPSHSNPTLRKFDIAPGGGANQAEVTVNDEFGLVTIYVEWS
jgi:hypothetical protein